MCVFPYVHVYEYTYTNFFFLFIIKSLGKPFKRSKDPFSLIVSGISSQGCLTPSVLVVEDQAVPEMADKKQKN